MIHVAWITHGFPEKPDGRYTPAVIELLDGLSRRYRITVFAVGHRPAKYGTYVFRSLKVVATGHLTPANALFRIPWLLIQFHRRHRHQPFRLIHGIWHVGSLWATLLGRLYRIPVVLSMLGGELVYLPEIQYGVLGRPHWRWILRRCLRLASRITVGSRYYAKRMVQFAPEVAPKLHLAPLGIPRIRFAETGKKAADSGPRRLRILVVAALQPVKNLVALIPLLTNYEPPGFGLNVTIAGTGPLHGRLQRLLHQSSVNGKITLSGWQHPDVFRRRYGHYDMLLSASLHEAQGMAMIEAAAAGLPILCTPVGVSRELERLGAAVVHFETMQQLPTKLTQVCQQLDQLKQQARRAREGVRAHYDIEKSVVTFQNVYEQAMHEPPWYEQALPLTLKIRRLLRPAVFRVLFPVIHFLRKRNAPTRIRGLEFDTRLEVFHPRYFFSSSVLLHYLDTLPMQHREVLDMGTGSGVVGVYCARRGARVVAVDILLPAVDLARQNAEKHGVTHQMRCLQSDLFEKLPASMKFDWIVFNPPFYAAEPGEPQEAAFYGGREARVLRRFAVRAGEYLKPGGRVVLILSSDMPLHRVHHFFRQAGFFLVDHRVKKHYFELFHLVQYGQNHA